MDQDQYQFLTDSYLYRLDELFNLAADLGRPLMLLDDTAEQGMALAVQLLQEHLCLTVMEPVTGSSEHSFGSLVSLIPCFPGAGKTSLIRATPGVFTLGLLASLDLDGVLVLQGSQISTLIPPGTDQERCIGFLANLVDYLELATDPEIDLEGQENHEAESLKKRLENPHLDSKHRHAPPVPEGLRAYPFSMLGSKTGSPVSQVSVVPFQAQLPETRTGKTLIILCRYDQALKKAGFDGNHATEYPVLSYLEKSLSAQGLKITALPARDPDKHHLHRIWELLSQWLGLPTEVPGPGSIREQEVLVLEEAWYQVLENPGYGPFDGDAFFAQALEECSWMEQLMLDSGVRVIKIAVRPD